MTSIASTVTSPAPPSGEGLVEPRRDVLGHRVPGDPARSACCSRWSSSLILLADIMSKALPVFAERGHRLPDQPAVVRTRQGRHRARASSGRSSSAVIVAVVAFPFGHRDRGLPRGVRAGHAPDAVHPDQHPQPRRRPVGRLRPARAGGVRRPVRVAGHAATAATSSPAALTLAVLVLPIVIITSVEALRAVPDRDPRGRLRRRRVALGGDPPARAAGRRRRAS